MRWAAPLIIVFAACGSSGQQGTGETPRVLAEGLPKVQALAVAGDVIVAAGEQILKIPREGNGPPVPLVRVSETRHLVAYQGSLFWTGAAGLQRLGPDESAPATVSADAGRFSDVAIDAAGVVWSSKAGDSLWQVPPRGGDTPLRIVSGPLITPR